MAHNHNIELVDKVICIIEALRDEPEGLGLQELAARTGYVKSSVHRILHSLRGRGYIEQESPGAPYRLGVQCLVLASGLAARIEIVKVARPYLRELVERFNESVYLAVLRGGKGIFVDVQDAHRDFRLIGPLGAEVHYHATAAGKAIAAFLEPGLRESLVGPLEPRRITGRTLVEPAAIERDWSRVRREGFAVNDEETIVGAAFLAAPLFDADARVCGSISVGVPKARFSSDLALVMSEHLVETCRRLSEELGATGYVHAHGMEASRAVHQTTPEKEAHYV